MIHFAAPSPAGATSENLGRKNIRGSPGVVGVVLLRPEGGACLYLRRLVLCPASALPLCSAGRAAALRFPVPGRPKGSGPVGGGAAGKQGGAAGALRLSRPGPGAGTVQDAPGD